ncbi:MAG: potassium channel family protein [Actinobacteria bacterium]|nr:potassium channel family protein [Actinomycetota bacterium]
MDRFERQTALPMLMLALAFIPVLLIPLLLDVSRDTEVTLEGIGWIIWGAFAAEYGIRLYLAPAKGTFVRRNLIDLLIIVVPFLRPLRIARSARALRLLQAARALSAVARGATAARVVLTRHKLHYALVVAAAVIAGSAVAIAEVERSATDSNIRSLSDGLWWAVTTVTTVGYGDRFPVTAVGRGIAVVLMVMGISLFGLLTASLASFFVERDAETSVDERLLEIRTQLEEVKQLLKEQNTREHEKPLWSAGRPAER